MWISLPPECLASVPESEDLTSDLNLLSRTLAQSLTWKSKRMQPASWKRAWQTAPWIARQFGPILRRSPSACSEAVWTWLSEAFLASHGAMPDPAGSGPTSAISGPTSSVCFATYDRNTSSWRRSQGSFVEDSQTFSDRWPRSGSMRSGMCFPPPKPARPTNASGSFF